MKWEYLAILIEHGLKNDDQNGKWLLYSDGKVIVTESISEILDKYGKEGWEVINVLPDATTSVDDLTVIYTYRVFFKRPLVKA